MARTAHILDVFTQAAGSGNPLAVILDAGSLTPEAMQVIATRLALSETVFVLPPTQLAHTARIRIFTPVSEVPFAGHPTIGTAILLAQLRLPEGHTGQQIVVLEEEIGNCMGLIGARSLSGLGREYLTRVTPMGPWHEHSSFRPVGPESVR